MILMNANPADMTNGMLVFRLMKPNRTIKEDAKENYHCDYCKNHISPELMFKCHQKVPIVFNVRASGVTEVRF
jgi:hypothetical protein